MYRRYDFVPKHKCQFKNVSMLFTYKRAGEGNRSRLIVFILNLKFQHNRSVTMKSVLLLAAFSLIATYSSAQNFVYSTPQHHKQIFSDEQYVGYKVSFTTPEPETITFNTEHRKIYLFHPD